MSNYIVYNGELYHHGVLGQRWGVRRFQNKDGSLTSAGKKHYGDAAVAGAKELASAAGKAYRKHHRVIGGVGSAITPHGGGTSGLLRAIQGGGKGREQRLAKKLATKGDQMTAEKKAKVENKLQAQQKLNADRAKYDAHISTGKMVVQDALLGYYGGEKYRNARARGASRLRAFFETHPGLPVDMYLRYQGNKKAYGDGMAAGVMDGENF